MVSARSLASVARIPGPVALRAQAVRPSQPDVRRVTDVAALPPERAGTGWRIPRSIRDPLADSGSTE
jgi:hypothetical protein